MRGRNVFLVLWAICMVLGGGWAGEAADWVLTPSIETRGEYLNNILYSPTLRKSDYIASAWPKLDFAYNTEVTQIGGSLKLAGLHYFHNSNLDRINQYYNFLAATQATPRLNLKLAANFMSTSNPQETLIATGVLTNVKLVTTLGISPGFTYLFTERWSNDLTYTFYDVNYQAQAYNNYYSHIINDRINFLLNEKTTLITSITAYYARYHNLGNTVAALGPQLGFTHRFSEKWSLTFLGGANFNKIDTNVGVLSFDNETGFLRIRQRRQDTTSVTPFFQLNTEYKWNTGNVSFNYVRNQSANAYQNQSQYNNFNLNFYQNITERLAFGLSPYFYLSTIEGGKSDFNSSYIGIRPDLTYKLTEKLHLKASYGYAYRTVTGTSNYSFPINNVWVSLSYLYPMHFQR